MTRAENDIYLKLRTFWKQKLIIQVKVIHMVLLNVEVELCSNIFSVNIIKLIVDQRYTY